MYHTCLLLALALAGCSYNLILMNRDTGAMGTGQAREAGINAGDLSIVINGKTYTGRWVAAEEGEQTFIGGRAGNTPFHVTSATSGGSVGTALLRAPDGDTLRCKFRYSGMSGTGIGECQDRAGTLYDMQID